MDANFWREKWENNEIAFHESEVNPILVKYFGELAIEAGGRVFVPLCGKTRDIAWLLSNGFRVVGVELIETAIEQLFAELGIELTQSRVDGLIHYSAQDIDIYVGDIFAVSGKTLGAVSAIYDRAALVALPEAMRRQYSSHLMDITEQAPQLLITLEYDHQALAGPPFSISKAEVEQHYGDSYELMLMASIDVPGGLKGKCAATENVWRLQNV